MVMSMEIDEIMDEVRSILSEGKQREVQFTWRSFISGYPSEIEVRNNLGDKLSLDANNYDINMWDKIYNKIEDMIHSEVIPNIVEYLSEKAKKRFGKEPHVDIDSDYWTYLEIDDKRYLVKKPEPIHYTEFSSPTYSYRRYIFNFADRYELEEM